MKYGENYVYDIDNIPNKLKQEEGVVMALSEMLKASRDDDVRELIEIKEKSRHDEATKLHHAKMSGIAEGEQIGIAKGEQIGIFKAKKELVITLLTKRFGALSENILNNINETNDIDILQRIIDNIFDISSIDDIIVFLDNNYKILDSNN